ncbi:MAG: polysaccharide pyruvyl transferase family protein [Caldicoprobacterales bacterium]
MSRSKVSEIMKIDVNVPLADPGLLASKLLSERRQKKYSVGIIPHFSQQQEEIFAKLNRHYQNSTIIDITKPPLEVIDNIASCEYIISSSLHGLVFADSLLIPSLPVVGRLLLRVVILNSVIIIRLSILNIDHGIYIRQFPR